MKLVVMTKLGCSKAFEFKFLLLLQKDTAAELKKAQRAVQERETNYKRARETALKIEQITREQGRIDKQRKMEEEAMVKVNKWSNID